MNKIFTRTLAAVSAVLICAGTATATTMPKADIQQGRNYFGIGLGGPSLSLDFGLTNKFSLGASASLNYLWRYAGGRNAVTGYQWYVPRFDIRGLYQFIEGGSNGLSVAGIFGIVGDPSQAFGSGDWGPELGIGLSYPFTPTITGRANLVAGYGGRFFAAPASGLELAFKLQPNMELAIAANGNGDLLGLRIGF
ncbi:MAG: hypothetical protein H7338_06290 [Candidatus Sericytochromatia bacterium]|nr:hypothetical protein [Candidatus Sericytochromatia bacterium]